jgi:hypothetical protein
MVAHADLRVRGVAGCFVALRPAVPVGSPIKYLGRGYNADDTSTLETEFPVLEQGEIVKSDAYIRKAIADGELAIVKE